MWVGITKRRAFIRQMDEKLLVRHLQESTRATKRPSLLARYQLASRKIFTAITSVLDLWMCTFVRWIKCLMAAVLTPLGSCFPRLRCSLVFLRCLGRIQDNETKDAAAARGRVGRVGVPACGKDDTADDDVHPARHGRCIHRIHQPHLRCHLHTHAEL